MEYIKMYADEVSEKKGKVENGQDTLLVTKKVGSWKKFYMST